MALMFGNLTQGFVSFSMVLLRAKNGDATAEGDIPAAAAAFRHDAAKDATYLVFIGTQQFFFRDSPT
jgi:ATP-binding cassette subfamily B (MDR/TAP) protein 1